MCREQFGSDHLPQLYILQNKIGHYFPIGGIIVFNISYTQNGDPYITQYELGWVWIKGVT
jgi:hypothetical protein